MKAEWLATVDGREYGPYSWEQLLQMAAEGRLPPDLPVKRLRDSQWYQAGQIPGLLPRSQGAKAVAPPPAAAERPVAPTPPPPPVARKDDSQLKRAKPLSSAGSKPAPRSAPTPPPPPPASQSAAAEPPAPPPAKEPMVAAASFPVIVTEGAAARSSASGDAAAASPRRRRSPLVVAGMAATALAAALVVAAVLLNVWMLTSESAAPLATAAGETPKVTPTSSAPRGPAGEEAEEASSDAPADGPSRDQLAAQAETVAAVSEWQSIAGLKSFGVANASLQIVRVWRAKANETAAKEADGLGASEDLLCIEIAIRNKSRSPLRYRGWNSYGPSGAILADENGNVLPLVPPAKTPQFERMTGGNVPGDTTGQEVLVFEAPADEGAVLHLVLPYGVFYSNVRPPYRAIEVTPDMLGIDLAGPSAAAQASAAAKGDAAATSAPAGAAAAAKAKDGLPPSIKDIVDNDPGFPMPTADPPDKAKPEDAKASDKPPSQKSKTENPFEPKR